jgi:hypothetical protein
MVSCGLLALWLGQDASFDQLNYHFYGPWALLHSRLMLDIAPAFTGPTFHNPLADVPFYLVAANSPPRVTGFFLGAVHGLLALPLFIIARALVPALGPATQPADRRSLWTAGLLVLAGMSGAMSIAETGTTFGDDLTAILVLAGLAAAVALLPRLAVAPLKRAAALALACAMPGGMAAGLKLTGAIYAGALVLAFLAVPRAWSERVMLVAAAGAGVAIGLAIAGGPWFFTLWRTTGNPTFPYLNQVFASPLVLPTSHRDDSFVPSTWRDAALFPFLVTLGRLSDSEFPFRDLRIPLLYALTLAFALTRPFATRQLPAAPRFVLTFAVTAYVPWLLTFAIARYLMPLELIAPALIAALIGALVPARSVAIALVALALITVVATTRPADWGRIAWDQDLYGVQAPTIEPDALVIMVGTAPTAFLIPFFPPQVPFIRADGFFTELINREQGLFRIGTERIRRHAGALYLIYRGDDGPRAEEVAARLGLVRSSPTCGPVDNRIEPADGPHGGILLCRVERRLTGAREARFTLPGRG